MTRKSGARAVAAFVLAGLVALAMAGFAPGGARAQDTGAQDTGAPARAAQERGAVTNLPLPRFVSLKGSQGNARRGPGLAHRIDWVFLHPGLPLMVTAEFEHWRRVEDAEGKGGWVHYALLSGTRTALVTAPDAVLRADPNPAATVIARAEPGAIVSLRECTPEWCRAAAGRIDGWIVRGALWGLLPGEILD